MYDIKVSSKPLYPGIKPVIKGKMRDVYKKGTKDMSTPLPAPKQIDTLWL